MEQTFSIGQPPEHAGRITGYNCIGRHIFGHNTARPNDCALTDRDATQYGCPGTNGGATLDGCGDAIPVCIGLQLAIHRCPRQTVVDKCYSVTDENLILQDNPFTNKGVAGDFATVSDPCPLLNFDKGSYFDIITQLAAVKIGKGKYLDPLAKLYIRGDALE